MNDKVRIKGIIGILIFILCVLGLSLRYIYSIDPLVNLFLVFLTLGIGSFGLALARDYFTRILENKY